MLVDNYKFASKCVIKSKTWFDIGKLIHSLLKGSEEGYKLWLMYSKTDYENYDEYSCYNPWPNLEWLTYNEFVKDDESNELNNLPEGY